MIRLTETIWIGDSADDKVAFADGITSILNVAQDLQGWRGWNYGIEYMQVGLIDGPGNTMAVYCAAVLALAELQGRRKTLVYCHSGGRALAVVMMYLNIGIRREWDDVLTLLRERVDVELPVPHEAHQVAFERINWRLLTSAMESVIS